MSFDSTEPTWCDECRHFVDVGPEGEGRCDVTGEDTWYGQIACEEFEPKEDDE